MGAQWVLVDSGGSVVMSGLSFNPNTAPTWAYPFWIRVLLKTGVFEYV